MIEFNFCAFDGDVDGEEERMIRRISYSFILCSPACREPILLLQLCGAAVLGILLYNVFCLLARQSSKLGGHFASCHYFI